MKKGLWMLGLAVAAMTSCTQSEVLEVAENRAIGFESFVGKSTRAVNDLTTESGFTKFFVYGSYDNGSGSYVSVYGNDAVNKVEANWVNEKLQYWVDGKNYKFAAYSDGNNKLTSGVTFTDATGVLQIAGYEVGIKDLIAVDQVSQTGKASNNNKVPLVFKHLLSKVQFTFSTTFGNHLTVTVTNLTVKQVENKGTWDGTQWTPSNPSVKADKSYDASGLVATSAGAESEECYVLPQSNQSLEASFTVTVTDEGDNTIAQKTFSNVSLASGNGDKWENGYAYNYRATIQPENMGDGDVELKPIEFAPTIEVWKDGTVTDGDILN